jgi:serine-type D-Ala-D-Ala endopeptidase (penicillin-binding protein 7)
VVRFIRLFLFGLVILTLVGAAPESFAAGRHAKKAYGKKAKFSRKGLRRAHYVAVPAIPDETTDGQPNLQSSAAIVLDQATGKSLFGKNTDNIQSIASITKIMTAMVVIESKQEMDDPITVDADDVDMVKGSRSHLPVGSVLRRTDMLRLALMASENRAASALARNYPGGKEAFVAQMNAKAHALGLTRTSFADSTGLLKENVSTVTDLAKLVDAAFRFDLIREYTTTPGVHLTFPETGRTVGFINTNRLINNSEWEIGLSKTGFINEAGQCLVMQARINNNPVVIVLLDSWGKLSRIADASRIKRWIESRRYDVAMAKNSKG